MALNSFFGSISKQLWPCILLLQASCEQVGKKGTSEPSSGIEPESSSEKLDDEESNKEKILVGRAIDGYIEGAQVFLDINGDLSLNEGEPSSHTNSEGKFELSLNADQAQCLAYSPLVAFVPIGANDLDHGAVEKAYKMIRPPKIMESFESLVNITPLTTVLWNKLIVDANVQYDLSCQNLIRNPHDLVTINELMERSIESVVTHYNIPEDKIYSDFIASNDSVAATKARNIVKGLEKSLTESLLLQKSYPNANFLYVDYHQGDYRDNEYGDPDAWYRQTLVMLPNKQITELIKVDDQLEQRLATIIYGEVTQLTDGRLDYSSSIEYESRFGEYSQFTCDIKEIFSISHLGKYYELNNLAGGSAASFEDCAGRSLTEAVDGRYLFVDFDENEIQYSAQLYYPRGSDGNFPFLNHWLDALSVHSTLDPLELVNEAENISYHYNSSVDASFNGVDWWVKSKMFKQADRDLTVRYNQDGNYEKITTFSDFTFTEECSSDGDIWLPCAP